MWKKNILQRNTEIAVATFFYYSGLTALARFWHRRAGKSLIILNYHRALGGDLRKHLLYLRRHYHLLHLETALEELYGPARHTPPGTDRLPPLVLTFDDGYHDNYRYATPLAKELQVPITIYPVATYVGSGQPFWWLIYERLVAQAQVDCVTLEGQIYHLHDNNERKALINSIRYRAWHATKKSEREEFLSSVCKLLALPPCGIRCTEAELAVSWDEIHAMESCGWVSFGAHTMNHPILAYISDPEELQYEVGHCRTMLEDKLGHAVRSFAYPCGQKEHIDNNSYIAVQKAGYRWAVTTLPGVNTPHTDPYLLKRVSVDVSEHWLMLAARTSGIWGFCSHLLWIVANPIRKQFGFDPIQR